ncbi:MAG TPA: hypothetical protein VLC79_03565 [Cellvibrio sp.]|nr:hypothetical protein [Cellvibrio sp.]
MLLFGAILGGPFFAIYWSIGFVAPIKNKAVPITSKYAFRWSKNIRAILFIALGGAGVVAL